MGRTIGVVILVLLAVIIAIISVSILLQTDDPFRTARDANVLLASFGVGMAVLAAGIALGPFRRGERWTIPLLLVWPAFFLVQILTLGTWLPGAFLLLSVIALVLGSRERSALPK